MERRAETSRSTLRTLTVRILFTVLAWAVLLSLVSWLFVALGWYLLALLWRRELMIPQGVASTVQALGAVLLWALVIFTGQLLWAKFNFVRYFKRNRRRLEPLRKSAPLPSWGEMTLVPPCPPVTAGTGDLSALSRRRRRLLPVPGRGSPFQLLSAATTLSLHGDLTGAMSALRLVISDPRTPHLVRQVAACRLAWLLNSFGHDRLARRLASHFNLTAGDEST